jgi:hypothetical protein
VGSIYKTYCYTTKRNDNYYVINFLIRSTSRCGNICGSYCGTQYEAECKNLEIIKDIEEPINQIVSTFTFWDTIDETTDW